MKLSEFFDRGEFVVTGEVGPVKGALMSCGMYLWIPRFSFKTRSRGAWAVRVAEIDVKL